MRKTFVALLLLAASGLTQAEVQLRADHPQSYTVQPGDTLWDISGKFLSQPWKWRELWQANPQVANPDLIYPGNVLSLVYVNGQPKLMVGRAPGGSGGTIKLSPKVRTSALSEAIPTIPLEKINSFLLANRAIEDIAAFNSAPYIFASDGERVVSGAGDRVYARGVMGGEHHVFGLFRQGKTYTDPQTGEVLGVNADEVGMAEVVATENNISTLRLLRTTQETRNGDRLLVTEERPISSTFVPAEPQQQIRGHIIDVPRGVTQVGELDVVVIDKGARDGLEEGSVLAIYHTGETVRDRLTDEQIKAPDERAGLLMVFRTYNKISYALVLSASRPLSTRDSVRNP